MVHKRSRKRHNKKRKHNKLSLVKRIGNQGHLYTKELLRSNFRMTADDNGIAIVNGYTTALANAFGDSVAWSEITQSPQYTTLWKQYRIRAIRYEFYPFATMAKTNDSSNVTQNELKWFWYKFNTGSNVNPQVGDPQVYNMCPKIRMFNKKIDLLYRRPVVMNTVWEDNTSVSLSRSETKPGGWFETDGADDVRHYGLTFGMLNCTPQAQYTVRCTRTIYFELRHQR